MKNTTGIKIFKIIFYQFLKINFKELTSMAPKLTSVCLADLGSIKSLSREQLHENLGLKKFYTKYTE